MCSTITRNTRVSRIGRRRHLGGGLVQAHRPSGRGIRARELRDGAAERVATLEGSCCPGQLSSVQDAGMSYCQSFPLLPRGAPTPATTLVGQKRYDRYKTKKRKRTTRKPTRLTPELRARPTLGSRCSLACRGRAPTAHGDRGRRADDGQRPCTTRRRGIGALWFRGGP